MSVEYQRKFAKKKKSSSHQWQWVIFGGLFLWLLWSMISFCNYVSVHFLTHNSPAYLYLSWYLRISLSVQRRSFTLSNSSRELSRANLCTILFLLQERRSKKNKFRYSPNDSWLDIFLLTFVRDRQKYTDAYTHRARHTFTCKHTKTRTHSTIPDTSVQ